MRTITDQIFEAGKGIITLEQEVSDHTGHYHMADDGGIETETGEFLFGLVRILQPNRILETGTYSGISGAYLGAALIANGHGTMKSIEVEQFHINRATELWKKVGVSSAIASVHQKSLDYDPQDDMYDLIFLDSEPEFRFTELTKFFKYLNEGGYFFIHDLHRHLSQHDNEKFFGWPFGELPEQIKSWIRNDELRVVSFPTPRGLTGFYKPAPGDYRIAK